MFLSKPSSILLPPTIPGGDSGERWPSSARSLKLSFDGDPRPFLRQPSSNLSSTNSLTLTSLRPTNSIKWMAMTDEPDHSDIRDQLSVLTPTPFPQSSSITQQNDQLAFPASLDSFDELLDIIHSIIGASRLDTLVDVASLRDSFADRASIPLPPLRSTSDSIPNAAPAFDSESVSNSGPDEQKHSSKEGARFLQRIGWRKPRWNIEAQPSRTRALSVDASSDTSSRPLFSTFQPAPPFRLLGTPLSELSCASCVIIIGGQKQLLPVMVFKIIEEVYQRGMNTVGLLKIGGESNRIRELLRAFEAAPSYGDRVDLAEESIHTLTSLLKRFLRALPQPLLDPALAELFWQGCVNDQSAKVEPISSRVALAQVILRMIPSSAFSLLVYLAAFLSQVPLFPENKLNIEQVAHILGPAILSPRDIPLPGPALSTRSEQLSASEKPLDPIEINQRARLGLIWLLANWNEITDGLLDEKLKRPARRPHPRPSFTRPLTMVEESSVENDVHDDGMTAGEAYPETTISPENFNEQCPVKTVITAPMSHDHSQDQISSILEIGTTKPPRQESIIDPGSILIIETLPMSQSPPSGTEEVSRLTSVFPQNLRPASVSGTSQASTTLSRASFSSQVGGRPSYCRQPPEAESSDIRAPNWPHASSHPLMNSPIAHSSPPTKVPTPSMSHPPHSSTFTEAQSIVDQYEAHGLATMGRLPSSGILKKEADVWSSSPDLRAPRSQSQARTAGQGLLGRMDFPNTYMLRGAGNSTLLNHYLSSTSIRSANASILSQRSNWERYEGPQDEDEGFRDPLTTLAMLMRSKDGMVRAQAETIRAQAELLADSERRLAHAATASSSFHRRSHVANNGREERLDELFIHMLNMSESIPEELSHLRNVWTNGLNKLKEVWESERAQAEEYKTQLEKEMTTTTREFGRVSEQLAVIRKTVGVMLPASQRGSTFE